MDLDRIDFNLFIDKVIEMVMLYVSKVLLVLIIFIVGLWIIGVISKVIEYVLEKWDFDIFLCKWFFSILFLLFKFCLFIFVVFMIGV